MKRLNKLLKYIVNMLNICFTIMYMIIFSLKFDVVEYTKIEKNISAFPSFFIAKGAGLSTNYPPDLFIILGYKLLSHKL